MRTKPHWAASGLSCHTIREELCTAHVRVSSVQGFFSHGVLVAYREGDMSCVSSETLDVL